MRHMYLAKNKKLQRVKSLVIAVTPFSIVFWLVFAVGVWWVYGRFATPKIDVDTVIVEGGKLNFSYDGAEFGAEDFKIVYVKYSDLDPDAVETRRCSNDKSEATGWVIKLKEDNFETYRLYDDPVFERETEKFFQFKSDGRGGEISASNFELFRVEKCSYLDRGDYELDGHDLPLRVGSKRVVDLGELSILAVNERTVGELVGYLWASERDRIDFPDRVSAYKFVEDDERVVFETSGLQDFSKVGLSGKEVEVLFEIRVDKRTGRVEVSEAILRIGN